MAPANAVLIVLLLKSHAFSDRKICSQSLTV